MITFDAETLKVKSDTTRDKYGDNTIKKYQCQTIEVVKNEINQDEYVLTECSGRELPYHLGVD